MSLFLQGPIAFDVRNLEALAPVHFTKETAQAVIVPVIEAIDRVVASASKQIVGNILLGSDDGIHTDRNKTLLVLIAMLWESKSEIVYQLESVKRSSVDDVSASVDRVNRCIVLDLPASCVNIERAQAVNRVQDEMRVAYLLRREEVKS